MEFGLACIPYYRPAYTMATISSLLPVMVTESISFNILHISLYFSIRFPYVATASAEDFEKVSELLIVC
jgi:hypothetical protein